MVLKYAGQKYTLGFPATTFGRCPKPLPSAEPLLLHTVILSQGYKPKEDVGPEPANIQHKDGPSAQVGGGKEGKPILRGTGNAG